MAAHTECLHLTPATGTPTRPSEIKMITAMRLGAHAHITLAHGVYGCNCPTGCRVSGIKEWAP